MKFRKKKKKNSLIFISFTKSPFEKSLLFDIFFLLMDSFVHFSCFTRDACKRLRLVSFQERTVDASSFFFF